MTRTKRSGWAALPNDRQRRAGGLGGRRGNAGARSSGAAALLAGRPVGHHRAEGPSLVSGGRVDRQLSIIGASTSFGTEGALHCPGRQSFWAHGRGRTLGVSWIGRPRVLSLERPGASDRLIGGPTVR